MIHVQIVSTNIVIMLNLDFGVGNDVDLAINYRHVVMGYDTMSKQRLL